MAQSTGDRQDFVFSVMDGSVPNTILRLTILQAWLPHFWPDVRVEKRGGGGGWIGGWVVWGVLTVREENGGVM